MIENSQPTLTTVSSSNNKFILNCIIAGTIVISSPYNSQASTFTPGFCNAGSPGYDLNFDLNDRRKLKAKSTEAHSLRSKIDINGIHSLDIENVVNYDSTGSNYNNVKLMSEALNREYTRFGHNVNLSKTQLDIRVNDSFKHLCSIKFEKMGIQLKKDNSIKYTFLFPHDNVLMITESLDHDPNDMRVAYSYFEGKELIVADAIEIKSLAERFNHYVSL